MEDKGILTGTEIITRVKTQRNQTTVRFMFIDKKPLKLYIVEEVVMQ